MKKHPQKQERAETHAPSVDEKGPFLLIAIIVGCIAILILGLFLLHNKSATRPDGSPVVIPDSVEEVVWKTYENKRFDFTVQYPEHWGIYVQEKDAPPVVTFFKKTGAGRSVELPLYPSSNATHVSIYPQGTGSEGPVGESTAGNIMTQGTESLNRNFTLKSGTIWATEITFAERPEDWTPWGLLWAGVAIEGVSYECRRGIETVPADSCNPVAGDTLVRSGNVDADDRAMAEAVIRSFAFTR